MNVGLFIDFTDLASEQIAGMRGRMRDREGLHLVIATETLAFVQGPEIAGKQSAENHKSADKLGAQRTGHLERAYRGIEQQSDAGNARLLVPAASRLRAAFGAYTVTPGPGKAYLTIAVNAEAYGRRAREFDDLVALRVGPKKTLILARVLSDGNLETMYFLTTSVNIPEDRDLLPIAIIADEARDVAEIFILGGDPT